MRGSNNASRLGLLFLLAALVTACAGTAPEQRRAQAAKLAIDAGWQRITLDAGMFALAAFLPQDLYQTKTLTIYIEGDGLAWVSSSTPSFDPTPNNPLALKLALSDHIDTAVYLARPCQYVEGDDRRGCEQKYWTSHRFAPEVIEASNIAVSQLKKRYAADKLRIIGYSGGGAVAALIAARRADVKQLITIAGNLDHAVWTKQHRLSPLYGSLNPADAWQQLQDVPQQHYVGELDTNINASVAQAFVSRFTADKQPIITMMPGFDHHCCWESLWQGMPEKDFIDN